MQEQKRKQRPAWKSWSFRHLGSAAAALYECRPEDGSRRNALLRIVCYVRRISEAYATHQCSLMACACAYCALLSLVPLLVVGIAALGFFIGSSQVALNHVIAAMNGYVPVKTEFLQRMLHRVLQQRGLIGLFGLIGLIFAAHQTFLAMEPAMNIIWGLTENRHWFRQRLVAVGAALYTLVLLGADLAVSAFIARLAAYSVPFVAGRVTAFLGSALLGLIPMLLTTLLFALLYEYLPARVVPWKAAFVGAGFAALLWQLTKVGFGVFLIYVHSYDRLYGSLSSMIVLVVWMYYTMAILLLGAEVAADYEFMGHDPRAAEARAHSGADLSAASGKETAAPVRIDEAG